MKKDEQEKNIQKNNVKKFPFKTSVEGKTEKQTFENLKKKASDDLEHKDSEEGNQNAAVMRSVGSKGLLIVGILLVVVVVYLFVSASNYNSYEVVEETSVKNAAIVDYNPYQKSLLKYSIDGATYVDEKDKAVWNETYAM